VGGRSSEALGGEGGGIPHHPSDRRADDRKQTHKSSRTRVGGGASGHHYSTQNHSEIACVARSARENPRPRVNSRSESGHITYEVIKLEVLLWLRWALGGGGCFHLSLS
jgi:hypothetical protein